MEHTSDWAVIHLRIVSPAKQAPYTLEELARLADTPEDLVRRYLDESLIEPVAGHTRTAWFFDENALYELRCIQRLRRDLGVNIPGIAVIRQLQREIERLKQQLHELRDEH
jgi:DNA-binding transcriptional MerR regulator